jgi:hypothetical protein
VTVFDEAVTDDAAFDAEDGFLQSVVRLQGRLKAEAENVLHTFVLIVPQRGQEATVER